MSELGLSDEEVILFFLCRVLFVARLFLLAGRKEETTRSEGDPVFKTETLSSRQEGLQTFEDNRTRGFR